MDQDEKYPSELADRFQVRMPAGMRDRIKAAAEANNRSMNAEILMALDYWLEIDLAHDVVFGAGADAREVGRKDWREVQAEKEQEIRKEIDRVIYFLKDLRRDLKVQSSVIGEEE